MTVLDISRGGVKIKALGLPAVKKGEPIELEFYLNNKAQTLIKKQVVIRNVKDHGLNTEVYSFDANGFEDKDIAFYLF